MPIQYDQKERVFMLQTPKTSYVLGVYEGKYLLHLYYGKRIERYTAMQHRLPTDGGSGFSATDVEESRYSTNVLPMEFPCYGSADYRSPAFHAEYEDGSAVTKLLYQGYHIESGKKPLCGLPATYAEDEAEAETLEITLKDAVTGLVVILSYTVFNNLDAIAKSVRVQNGGNQKINIKSLLSSASYLFDKDYEFVHLAGAWARERHIQKQPLQNSTILIDSKRVSSSHMHSPFMVLARPYTTETQGDVYGCSLIYSGNFIARAETSELDTVRLSIGINPFGFQWCLNPGEEFQAPEAVLVYAANGFGEMSRTYHKLYRTRLCRGKFRDTERPVLINNWEATYFDFNEEKILDIAKSAKKLGMELLVLDDGWFGKRDSDNCSLGDWVADRRKLPDGIDGLAKKVTALGMQFGLWFEPEMISRDSDLFRAHPDWHIHVEGRTATESRQQLVLDLSREDVQDYIVDAVSSVLRSAPISYVKWDMNRNITEIGSAKLPPARQQELPHRYILGLYQILERITSDFPDVLFEGCSGGGGRFDAGMLYYFPQYWTSDDTDAIERLFVQHGTSMVFPLSTMGAHVSAVPNHQLHRTTPLATRGHVAMVGQFGYELDITKFTEEEAEAVKEQIAQYKQVREIFHQGDFYRLKSPFEGEMTAWLSVLEDQSAAALMVCTRLCRVQPPLCNVKLEGLCPAAQYKLDGTDEVYDGDYLMNVGLYFPIEQDFESKLLVFQKMS